MMQPPSTSAHAYQGLVGPNFIRLLSLHPRRQNDKISCTLRQVCLDDVAGQYTALSYVWGDSQHTKTIDIDNTAFETRQNLYDFLYSRPQGFTAFWIDAVCIDQKNLAEREQQVGMMNRIYTGAKEVHAWLGPSDPAVDPVFDAYDREGEEFAAFERQYAHQIALEERHTNPFYHGVARIRRNAYFSRMWIIPELLLAEKIIFWVGSRSMPMFAVRCLQSKQDEKFSTCDLALNALNFPRPGTLHVLVQNYGAFDCLLLHDKVYALYGVAQIRDRGAAPFPVRYKEDILTLFARTIAQERTTRTLPLAHALAVCLKLYSHERAQIPLEFQGKPPTTMVTFSIPTEQRIVEDNSPAKLPDDLGRTMTAFTAKYYQFGTAEISDTILVRNPTLRVGDDVYPLGSLHNKTDVGVVVMVDHSRPLQERDTDTVMVQTGIEVSEISLRDKQLQHEEAELVRRARVMRSADLWDEFWTNCDCTLATENGSVDNKMLKVQTSVANLLQLLEALYGPDGIFEREQVREW